jgi:hypothetical protein
MQNKYFKVSPPEVGQLISFGYLCGRNWFISIMSNRESGANPELYPQL